jgi:hypothetical protein
MDNKDMFLKLLKERLEKEHREPPEELKAEFEKIEEETPNEMTDLMETEK